MRLGRLGDRGAEIPVVIESDRVLDLRSVIPDLDSASLAPPPLERVRTALAARVLPEVLGAAAFRRDAPVARPSSVFCIGMDYAAHVAESGGTAVDLPILFLKTLATAGGPDDPVDILRGSVRTDGKVELGIVIGSQALYLSSSAESRRRIAGFVAANDLSERDWQLRGSGGQWSTGKIAPGFNSLGPWLVTADELDPGNLRLRSWRTATGLAHLRHAVRCRLPGLASQPVHCAGTGRRHPDRYARRGRALGALPLSDARRCRRDREAGTAAPGVPEQGKGATSSAVWWRS